MIATGELGAASAWSGMGPGEHVGMCLFGTTGVVVVRTDALSPRGAEEGVGVRLEIGAGLAQTVAISVGDCDEVILQQSSDLFWCLLTPDET